MKVDNTHFLLKGHEVVSAEGMDLSEWAQKVYGEDGRQKRRVAATTLMDGTFISTVFLGMDHNWGRIDSGKGEPWVFESMVFKDDWNEQDTRRYSTWEEAQQGHDELVAEWRGKLLGE